jgi:hypothetical protein
MDIRQTAMPCGRLLFFLAVLMATVTSGCTRQELLHKFASPEEEARAKKFVPQAGSLDEIKRFRLSGKSPLLARRQRLAAASQ